MRVRGMAVLAAAGVVALTATVGTFATVIGTAGPAGAADHGSCTKVSGNVNTTVTVSKCTPEPGSKAKLTIPSPATLTLGQPTNLTWTWKRRVTSGSVRAVSGGYEDEGSGTGCSRGSDQWNVTFWVSPSGDSTGTISAAVLVTAILSVCVKSNGTVKAFPQAPPLSWSTDD
jgi:hypothetical protein